MQTIAGAPPDLAALPPGCSFADRCGFVVDACRAAPPPLAMLSPRHGARCIRTDATAASS